MATMVLMVTIATMVTRVLILTSTQTQTLIKVTIGTNEGIVTIVANGSPFLSLSPLLPFFPMAPLSL